MTDLFILKLIIFFGQQNRKLKKMAAYAAVKPTKQGLEETQERIHKIRITLSSKNVKNLEKGTLVY